MGGGEPLVLVVAELGQIVKDTDGAVGDAIEACGEERIEVGEGVITQKEGDEEGEREGGCEEKNDAAHRGRSCL